MTTSEQRAKAERFSALHNRERILVLPNAWDVSSARIFEDAGFRAIGTTSAGIAATLGRPDGQALSLEEMLETVGRIAAAVELPVTADLEAGYGETPKQMQETTRSLIACGAVGLNIEDSNHNSGETLIDVSSQVEKIKGIRQASHAAGVPVVINVRTDVYLLSIGDVKDRFSHAVHRANLYREAGADCLFIPGVQEPDVISGLVGKIKGPINILAREGVPAVTELERLGVARVSVGSGPQRATMTLVRSIAKELINGGTYTTFTGSVMSHADVNRFFGKR